MRTTIVGLVLILSYGLVGHDLSAQTPQKTVRWTESVLDARSQQKKTGRPILVYVTADYCGHCRRMERDTWSNPDVAQQISENFIALKLDAEKHEELVSKLGVKGLPSTLIVDADGTGSDTIVGYSGPKQMLKTLVGAQPPAAARNTKSGSSTR